MAREANVWLSFRGVDSEAAGTRGVKLPAPPAAAPRGALVEIPGRDGALWQAGREGSSWSSSEDWPLTRP